MNQASSSHETTQSVSWALIRDKYLSNHELLELQSRVAREREAMRKKFEGRMPTLDDLSRLPVIVAYDN